MADIPVSRVATKAKDKAVGILTSGFWYGDLGPAGLVLLVGVLLSAFHIEFQYIAGAAVAVFARRLASKRIAPQVHTQTKYPEPERPVRETFAKMGDRKAAEMDYDFVG